MVINGVEEEEWNVQGKYGEGRSRPDEFRILYVRKRSCIYHRISVLLLNFKLKYSILKFH
jgi:hypothetical protein